MNHQPQTPGPSAPDYNAIGYDIIGAAFRVYNTVGRLLRENYYEAALAYELTQAGHTVQRQVPVPALYKGEEVRDAYQADIIVDNCVIIELKAVSTMKEAESRQLLTYLRLSGFKLGYLINFGTKTFKIGRSNDFPLSEGIYRFVNNL